MNNTINNVPRELLERAWRALANSATGREIGAYLDADPCAPECAETCARASMCATCSADLSAQSPAGVDGLEVRAYEHVLHMELGQKECFFSEIEELPFGVKGEDFSATYDVSSDPLCRLSGAQAIIDGLRGEVERSDRARMNQFETLGKMQLEREHLFGLLREAYSEMLAIKAEIGFLGNTLAVIGRIDAALSAGKEGE